MGGKQTPQSTIVVEPWADDRPSRFVKSLESPTPLMPPYAVHIDDVAEATLVAATVDMHASRRLEEFILSYPVFKWEDVAKYVRDKHPSFDVKLQGPFPEYVGVRATKAEKVLGCRWRHPREMADGVLGQQEELRGVKVGCIGLSS